MTRMMRAAILTGPQTFEVRERDIPQPAPGSALIALSRAGICGGDLQQYRRASAALPVVPGHEGCGTVLAAPEHPSLQGMRVVFDPQVYWCGRCEWCASGSSELCCERRYLGAQVDGTFAEYVAVPCDRLYPLPASMTWDEAASVHGLAGCVFAAQRFAHVVGESVAVLGPGAAGLLFVQLEKHCFGAGRVILAGRSKHRLDLGSSLGADAVVNTLADNLVEKVLDLTRGRGVDVIIETTGSAEVRQALPAMAAPRARILSYATGPIGFDSLKSISVFGTTGATRSMQPALDLIASGRVRTGVLVSHRYPLHEIQSAFDTAVSDAKGDYVKGVFTFRE